MHRLFALLTAFVLASPVLGVARVLAHAGEEILPVRLAVTEWASALQSDDARVMAELLSERFPGKQQYIATLPLTPITRVDLRHATLNIRGDVATFTPVVVFPMVNMLNPEALSLTLEREEQQWRIVEIAPTTDVPN
jgi:hypothetical protein